MNFSEFLREEEELELLDEALLEEGVIGGSLRALGGFGGNLLTQTARGIGNVASGATQALGGVGKVGLGAVQGVTGGGRKALSSIGSGVSDVASGVGRALKGTAQAAGAVSGVTPTIRGIQAATEKSFLTPMSNRRTSLQQAMGLNSWDPEGDAKKDTSDRFDLLKAQYAQAHKAGDGNLKRRIRAEMEKVDRVAYKAIVAKSQAARAEHGRRRWQAVADRVGNVEKPEDFLGRLATEQ